MPLSPDLTVRETAFLAGVAEKTVEKALEAGVLAAVPAPARFRGGATRFLSLRAVAFFHALDAADLADLPRRHKRALWDQLMTLKPGPLQAIEFAPGATLDLESLAARALRTAERYRELRDRHIAPQPKRRRAGRRGDGADGARGARAIGRRGDARRARGGVSGRAAEGLRRRAGLRDVPPTAGATEETSRLTFVSSAAFISLRTGILQ